MTVTSQFPDMTSSSNFFDGIVSHATFSYRFNFDVNIMTGSLVLELWQFTFMRDWSEIQKSEIPPSGFYPISGDTGELGIPNLERMSLMKYYWLLQNARVTSFTVFELLRENQQGEVKLPSPPRLGLKIWKQARFFRDSIPLFWTLSFSYQYSISH